MDDLEGFIDQGDIEEEEFDNRLGVICDPQTSGGILAAIPAESSKSSRKRLKSFLVAKPARIGYITEGNAGHLTFSDS